MQPFTDLSTYSALNASKLLRDPCVNCHQVLRQLVGDKTSKGETVLQRFGVRDLQKRIQDRYDGVPNTVTAFPGSSSASQPSGSGVPQQQANST